MSIQHLAGQTLGQYELRDLLGAGGMGAVYRGYQTNLKRFVAVKVLAAQLAEQPGYIERFNREAQTAASLEHSHIIRVYDYGTQRGISFLVMQLLTGGTLAERITQRAHTPQPLPSLGEIADLLNQLAGALDYAHSRGVVHRDIKPSNVMFDSHGTAYLVDFGIAKLVESTGSGLTASGSVMGTWGYMAPEQWKNEALTAATDQYALAVMTYALVTGFMPFEAQTPAGIMQRHLNEMPTPPHTRRTDAPETITPVIERALAKDPARRFGSVVEFAQAFARSAQGQSGEKTDYFTMPLLPKTAATVFAPIDGAPPVSMTRTRQAIRSWTAKPSFWVMGLVAILVVAVLVYALLSSQGTNKQNAATPTVGVVAQDTTPGILILDTATSDPLSSGANFPLTEGMPALPTETFTRTPSYTPSPTDTPTLTPSPTDTPDIEATAEAMLAERLTGTALAWTATPTPDIEATVRAAMTGTAQSWTYTPSPTATFTPTLTLTPTFTQTATFTPPPTATPVPVIPTQPPLPQATFTPIPVVLAVRASNPGTLDAARQNANIWDGLTFINLEGPGMQTYYQAISTVPYRWAFSWCGRDATHLQEILRPYTISFYVDDVRVDPSALLQVDTNSVCRNWVTVLDGWRSGSTVTLDVRYHLSEAIMGGTGIRNPGDYTQRIYVTVR